LIVQDLPALLSTYLEINRYFDDLRSRYFLAGNVQAVQRIENRRGLNNQAYFVLCWGQFEVAVDGACRAAIRKRLASRDWSVRRAWDRYNPDERRLSGLTFEDRAALVIDRRGVAGSPWARVQFFYALRNQMAHGRLRSDRIDVTGVVAELYQIQGALTV
jgi:hypothetical protein